MANIHPVPNATHPYWRSEPHWTDEYRSTPDLPSEADIVIIGTGIAGVSTAYHLLNSDSDKQPSILLLEARQVCSGATGRNGGHIKKLPSTINDLIQGLGRENAEEVVQFVRQNIYAVKEVIEKDGIQAEAELRRSFDVALETDDAQDVKRTYLGLREAGFPLMENVHMVEEHVERITSLKKAKLALSTPVLSLWPYKFITQLLERVLRKGNVNLQTNTLVTDIKTNLNNNNIHTIFTTRGQIKTPSIIFATNGYTAGLLPQYRTVITPAKATASHITVPPGKEVPYLSNTYNIRYNSNHTDYLNPRPDGGIVVGGGKPTYRDHRELWYDVFDDSTLLEPARHYFDGLMQRSFRGWEDSQAETERVWTGIQGLTPDGMPHVGKVPGTAGQYILAGYNGGGMALAFLAARGVARMVGEGVAFEDAGVPGCMEATEARMKGA